MDLPLQLLMVVLTCLTLPQLYNPAIINKNMDSLSGQGSPSVSITWGLEIVNLVLHVNIIILETGVHPNLIICSALFAFHFVQWVTWTHLLHVVGTSATCLYDHFNPLQVSQNFHSSLEFEKNKPKWRLNKRNQPTTLSHCYRRKHCCIYMIFSPKESQR
jgi:hypothetical protein